MQETVLADLVIILTPLLKHIEPHVDVKALLVYLQSLVPQLRKELITLSRGMSIPRPRTTLFAKVSDLLSSLPENIAPWITSLSTHPISSGLLISLCISLPMPESTVRQIYTDMLAKEMLIMESSPLFSQIHYNTFFGDYTTPIHPSVPPNPRQAFAVHQLIENWILSLERRDVIFPHITSKLCSKATQLLVKERYPEYLTFEVEGATQADLEFLYMSKGDMIDGGPCEIKQRWYTSGLFPRTYYAAGSDAYHHSKYVRDALNSLCDFLPPTERFARVNPHRVVLSDKTSHAIIYDLTSFTSNMHEQRHFMNRLGLYCRGRTVRIMDAVEGIVEKDLGDLLLEYNSLNTEPLYSSSKLIGKDVELTHHVAGFLGVFGNLASCTFLHGAVMSQLVSSFDQLGIAGDDGIIDSKDDAMTFFVIRLLGLMEPSKYYNTADEGWQIYLKRPIKQFNNRVYSDSFAIFAMLEHLFSSDDRRFFPVQRPKLERLSSLANSLVIFLKSLSRLQLDPDLIRVVHSFLEVIYQRAGFPVSGYLPQVPQDDRTFEKLPQVLIPTLREDFIGRQPIEMTIRSLYNGVTLLPDFTEEFVSSDSDLLFQGSEFEATGSRYLSYLRKLGFVEMEKKDRVFIGEEGFQLLLEHFTHTRKHRLYIVRVLQDVPSNLLQ